MQHAECGKIILDISDVFEDWGRRVRVPLEERNAALERELAAKTTEVKKAKTEAYLYKELYLYKLNEQKPSVEKKEGKPVRKRRTVAEVDRESRAMFSEPKRRKRREAPHGMMTDKDFFLAAFEMSGQL